MIKVSGSAFLCVALVFGIFGCESGSVSKADACSDFCASAKKCDEDAGKEIDGDYLDSCTAACNSGMGVDPPPSGSQIQSCADSHLSTCNQQGFGQCILMSNEGGASSMNDTLLIMTLFESACAKNFECCGDPSPENMIQTVEECSGMMGAFMMMGIQAGQDAGFLEIDSAKLSECKEVLDSAIEASSCEEQGLPSAVLSELNAMSCDEFMVGKQEEGEDCSYKDPGDPDAMNMSSDEYCVSGLVCSRVEGEENKQCLQGLAAGEACEGFFGMDCAAGLVCGADSTCTEPLADGAACSDDDHCDSDKCTAEFGDDEPGECITETTDPCGDW